MKQILKNFPSLQEAVEFRDALYSQYDRVQLIDYPLFEESGEYVFSVD